MFSNILTIDDYNFEGKTAIVRIDINSPMDPKTGKILDDRRFLSHRDTLKELVEKGAKVVLIAHQGRPGDADFTTLERHAEFLEKIIGSRVKYVDSIFSSYVINEIKNMRNGDVILLENVRFYSEEVLNRPPDAQAKTFLVKKLKSMADVYVDDAFATAHRSQPSMVGFPLVLDAVAGRLMEKELKAIWNIMQHPEKPVAFILGGTKADDSIRAAKLALENGTDYILTGGVVGNIFLAAKGYRIGEPSIEFIRGKKMVDQIDIAKSLLGDYEDRILLPEDLALDSHGERMEIPVSELPKNYRIADIGEKTIARFAEIINKC
ncbi:MAG TPA: phosphoglycerate kinase, partial [Candidatus Altiarchaeales archaeon]|nr:phosphoglycerate kinase [Candidatus Altiarchaeales archaeon]